MLLLGIALAWGMAFSVDSTVFLGYSMSLRDAEGLTYCSYKHDYDIKDDRLPRIVEIVRCFTCGKECNPHGKPTAACMELTSTVLVTYSSTGLSRNESFPVSCACVLRQPKKGIYDQVNIVQ